MFAAQMGILEVGLKGRKKVVSIADQQSIAQMKELIAAQNRKRKLVLHLLLFFQILCFLCCIGSFRPILSLTLSHFFLRSGN